MSNNLSHSVYTETQVGTLGLIFLVDGDLTSSVTSPHVYLNKALPQFIHKDMFNQDRKKKGYTWNKDKPQLIAYTPHNINHTNHLVR